MSTAPTTQAEQEDAVREALDYLRMPEVTSAKYAVVPVKGDRKALAVVEAAITEMRAENARLRIAFHDAIRRPLGVTPDSGAEFYDPRMADEAEARRSTPSASGGNPAYSAAGRLVQSQAAWPAGCIKPGSCSRHAGCMYAQSPKQCRHFGKDLTADIVRADRARGLDQHSLTKNQGVGDE